MCVSLKAMRDETHWLLSVTDVTNVAEWGSGWDLDTLGIFVYHWLWIESSDSYGLFEEDRETIRIRFK